VSLELLSESNISRWQHL